jgi:antirestriction protein ArdC
VLKHTSDRKNEATGEKESKSYSFLKYFTVFNIEQAKGFEAPAIETPAHGKVHQSRQVLVEEL